MGLFDEARDCYDKYSLPYVSTYTLVDTFSWILATATYSVDWGSISSHLSKHLTKDDGYTADEVLEVFYPREFYPERYI